MYLFDGSGWVYVRTTREAKNKFALGAKTSITQLFGDTFAKTSASSIFLLEDLTDKQGGTSLTANGGITTLVEQDLPLRGFTVHDFDGTDDFLSIPTEAKVEVGADSFLVKIDFKTDDKGTFRALVAYGDEAGVEQNWALNILSDKIGFTLESTTSGIIVIQDTIAKRWQDGKWHTAIVFVDRTTNICDVLVGDNPANMTIVASASISALGTETLNNVGESLRIGARKDTTVGLNFKGQIANFQLYKMTLASEDYNLPAILAGGIRESAAVVGTGTNLQTRSGARTNSRMLIANANLNYNTTLIHTDEGFYDLTRLHGAGANFGITDIDIDGIERYTFDNFSGSASENNSEDPERIFLSEGWHILKIRIDGQNGSSTGFFADFNFINLIKRDGTNEGGATSFTLFGDEIVQEVIGSNWNFAIDTGKPFNNLFGDQTTALTVNDSASGILYNKKGLYKITLGYEILSGAAKIDLDANKVEILDAFDMSVGSASEVAQKTVFVRLDGGKIKWILKVNAVGSIGANTLVKIWSIRGELVSGTGYGDKVRIFAADDDGELVSSTQDAISVNTAARFNFFRQSANVSGAEILFRRYFSGGTYALDAILPLLATTGGITDILVDSTVVLDDINQNGGGATFNNKKFAIVEITRGFHDIHIKNVADGGASDFRWLFQELLFTLIGRSTQSGDSQDTDNENGNRVLLGIYTARKAEATTPTIEMADLKDKYSHFEIESSFEDLTNASAIIQMRVNGQTATNYVQDGSTFAAGVETLINISATQFDLIPLSAFPLNFPASFLAKIMPLERSDGLLMGSYEGMGRDSYTHGSLINISETIKRLESILVTASLGNWLLNSTVKIYGVKK